MKRWWQNMKEWPHGWAIIDIVLLGGGLILSSLYFFYSSLLPEHSPLRDLWLNISTDLLVVWLSVRIIDSRIKAREKRSGIRVLTGMNLNLLLRIGQDLSPKFYDFDTRALKRETTWSAERFEERKKVLDDDEREDVWAAISTAQTLIEPATRREHTRQEFEELESHIRESDFHYYDSKWFKDASRLYNSIQAGTVFDAEAVNNDMNDITSEFQQEQSQVPQSLVPVVQNYLAALRSLVTIRSEVEAKVKELEEKVLKARNNIFSETRPD